MNLARLPGFGDAATWPAYPRAYDDEVDDARDAAITARTAELLATPDFTPCDSSNLCEALYAAPEKRIAPISAALASGDMSAAGEALRQMSHAYWHSLARDEAARQIDKEARARLPCCGRGCDHCEH